MAADFEVFIKVLMGIAAVIVAVGGAYTFFEHLADRAATKQNKIAEQVAEHERKLEKQMEYLDNDNSRLKEMEESNRLIMRGMISIIAHEIDGNHIEQLQKARHDIDEYLINR